MLLAVGLCAKVRLSIVVKKFGWNDTYCGGQPSQDEYAGVSFSTLDVAQISQVNLSLESELFLRQALLDPKAPYVLTHDGTPILHCRSGLDLAYSL